MVESVIKNSRRGVQILAIAAGMLLVTAGVLIPSLNVDAQGLGNCPAGATIKVDPPVDGTYSGIGVDFSADGTSVQITAPAGFDVTFYGFGGTSFLQGPFTVLAGTSQTFQTQLGPQEQPQQYSHICLGLTAVSTTTTAATTTTTSEGATTTTTVAATTTTAAVLPTTIVQEVTTTTAAVLPQVVEEEPEEEVLGVVVEAPEAEPAQPSVERPRFTG